MNSTAWVIRWTVLAGCASVVHATPNFHQRYSFVRDYEVGTGDKSMIATSDGGFLSVGTLTDASGNQDAMAIKSDAGGNVEWSFTYGDALGDEQASSVLEIDRQNDSGYVIVGTTDSHSSGNDRDILVIKTRSDGTLRWARNYGAGGNFYEAGTSIVHGDPFLGYVILGESVDVSLPIPKLHLLAIDPEGAFISSQTLEIANQSNERGAAITRSANGNYIVVGETRNVARFPDIDVLLLELDQRLQVVQGRIFIGNLTDVATSVLDVSDGGSLVGGITRSCTAAVTACGFALRLDAGLNLVWEGSYHVKDNENYVLDIDHGVGGGFVLAGMSNSPRCGGSCPEEAWLFGVDDFGTPLWSRSYPFGKSPRRGEGHWFHGVERTGSDIAVYGQLRQGGYDEVSLLRADHNGEAPCGRMDLIRRTSTPWVSDTPSVTVIPTAGDGLLSFTAIDERTYQSECYATKSSPQVHR